MTKKRGHGEGTIHKRKNGRWEAKISIGHDLTTGKLKRVTFYGKTREEVRDKLTKALNDYRIGAFVEPNKITVGQWMDTWLEAYDKPKVATSTFALHETLVKIHIRPSIGSLELFKLRPSDLQQLYNNKLERGRLDGKGLSEQTVIHIHALIYQALKQAVKEGLLFQNPAESTTRPKLKKREVKPIPKEKAVSFLEVTEENRLYALFSLALGTGLRRGELLGLKWSDIEVKKDKSTGREIATLTVKRSLNRIKDETGVKKTALIFGRPKTEKSRRIIPLPDVVWQDLKRHRVKQNKERLFFGQKYVDNDLVFATEEGKPIEPSNFAREYKKMMEKAGLEYTRFHNWRHTFATLMLELGEHPKTVQEILGHSKISTTLDTYSHVSTEMMERAASRLNEVLKEKRNNKPQMM